MAVSPQDKLQRVLSEVHREWNRLLEYQIEKSNAEFYHLVDFFVFFVRKVLRPSILYIIFIYLFLMFFKI